MSLGSMVCITNSDPSHYGGLEYLLKVVQAANEKSGIAAVVDDVMPDNPYYTGKYISAKKCREYGLVGIWVPQEDFMKSSDYFDAMSAVRPGILPEDCQYMQEKRSLEEYLRKVASGEIVPGNYEDDYNCPDDWHDNGDYDPFDDFS